MKIDIKETMYSEIQKYCEVNNIENVDKFIGKILNQGFTAEKWGTIGENKPQVIEKIVEKIIISAITQDPQIIYTGESINVAKYEINVVQQPKEEKKDIEFPIDNTDFYGEQNFRQIK